jgi:polysaccharide pyruvyl transferase WcaK-like protein
MLRFGLFGVAGHNRGDDAISLSVIDGVRGAIGPCDILVAVLKGATASPRTADRTVIIDRRSAGGLWSLLRAIASVDVVLLGGGSLIQDRLGGSRVKGVIGYAWTITTLARYLKKPVYTVPLGIDELRTDKAVAVAREVLANVRCIALRDQLSLRQLQKIRGTAGEGTVFCDPVFGWTPPLAAPQQPSGIVLAPAFEGVDDDIVSDIFAATITELLQRDPSLTFTIIAMDSRIETDAGKIGGILARLPADARDATSISVPDSAEAAAALLRNARAVVAMRLHAVILAYGHARCFCLSRTTKTTALLTEFQVDGLEYGNLPIDQVAARAVASVFDGSLLAAQQATLTRLRTATADYYQTLKHRLESDGFLDHTPSV